MEESFRERMRNERIPPVLKRKSLPWAADATNRSIAIGVLRKGLALSAVRSALLEHGMPASQWVKGNISGFIHANVKSCSAHISGLDWFTAYLEHYPLPPLGKDIPETRKPLGGKRQLKERVPREPRVRRDRPVRPPAPPKPPVESAEENIETKKDRPAVISHRGTRAKEQLMRAMEKAKGMIREDADVYWWRDSVFKAIAYPKERSSAHAIVAHARLGARLEPKAPLVMVNGVRISIRIPPEYSGQDMSLERQKVYGLAHALMEDVRGCADRETALGALMREHNIGRIILYVYWNGENITADVVVPALVRANSD